MCSAAPNTNNPLRTRLKHIKLSLCPVEISPQHKTNSLDANVARCGVLQHAQNDGQLVLFDQLCRNKAVAGATIHQSYNIQQLGLLSPSATR